MVFPHYNRKHREKSLFNPYDFIQYKGLWKRGPYPQKYILTYHDSALRHFQRKYKPKKNEPKIWFNSIKSLANVLSKENQELLQRIIETHPKSISELEETTGRKANNLLRTLRTMENYGFVKLIPGNKAKGRTPLIPKVIYNVANVEINLCSIV